MAPVAYAAYSLYTARSVWGALICNRILLFLGEPVTVTAVEPLPEAFAHLVPAFSVRVTDHGLVRGSVDVVRQRKPVIVAAT